MKFIDMMNEVHVDEKWFFLCKESNSYILIADEEEPPKRYVKHKSHIQKVMFLCAQARPRMVNGTMWDGKIGIWPIGEWKAAQRSSVHWPAGTMEFKSKSVDQDTYRELLCNEVLPAICAQWPQHLFNRQNYKVIIQQDGAKSHIKPTDPGWLATLEALGVNNKVELYTQPANSPDHNLNDLGFFNALQSMYHCTCPTNITELIDMVKQSYNGFETAKINRIWLTLQSCLNMTIDKEGDNIYKIPHMNKAGLERQGRLPKVLVVTEEARQYLNNNNNNNNNNGAP